ncbi:hypothetical protein HC028_09795 [Planosporangium flavigriseum]|uniref:Uncharacterized protein n=1 Tax=Planosporangium flavigriseum TaxID=373681 RepID=A0A8J3PKB6_9ACTN|nr:hypothetical protein [Planosporangium flavigriseum]NJC64792.1 hypothetical protein [Planosporangium flavigriseum]GIG72662.1 hypothetical protein Pfl04_10660 [Planosporangium flavigriseum]
MTYGSEPRRRRWSSDSPRRTSATHPVSEDEDAENWLAGFRPTRADEQGDIPDPFGAAPADRLAPPAEGAPERRGRRRRAAPDAWDFGAAESAPEDFGAAESAPGDFGAAERGEQRADRFRPAPERPSRRRRAEPEPGGWGTAPPAYDPASDQPWAPRTEPRDLPSIDPTRPARRSAWGETTSEPASERGRHSAPLDPVAPEEPRYGRSGHEPADRPVRGRRRAPEPDDEPRGARPAPMPPPPAPPTRTTATASVPVRNTPQPSAPQAPQRPDPAASPALRMTASARVTPPGTARVPTGAPLDAPANGNGPRDGRRPGENTGAVRRRAVEDSGAVRRRTLEDSGAVRRRTLEDSGVLRRRTAEESGTSRRRAVDDSGAIRRRTLADSGVLRRRTAEESGTNRRRIPDTSGTRPGRARSQTAGQRASTRPLPGWLSKVLVVVAVLVLAAVGLGGYILINSQSQPAPTKPAASGAGAKARDISSRSVDPAPLTEQEVFSGKQVTAGSAKYQVLKTQATDCRTAATDDVATLLGDLGCSQVVRGTLKSGDSQFLITAGIFNLNDETGANKAYETIKPMLDAQKGRFTGLAAGDGTEAMVRAPTTLGWHPLGHFLAYSIVARADGKPIAADDPASKQAISDVVEGYLRDTVLAARAGGQVSTPK